MPHGSYRLVITVIASADGGPGPRARRWWWSDERTAGQLGPQRGVRREGIACAVQRRRTAGNRPRQRPGSRAGQRPFVQPDRRHHRGARHHVQPAAGAGHHPRPVHRPGRRRGALRRPGAVPLRGRVRAAQSGVAAAYFGRRGVCHRDARFRGRQPVPGGVRGRAGNGHRRRRADPAGTGQRGLRGRGDRARRPRHRDGDGAGDHPVIRGPAVRLRGHPGRRGGEPVRGDLLQRLQRERLYRLARWVRQPGVAEAAG